MITLTNVNVFYGQKKAIDNCSLTVEEGERVALVGPNGAGKTTLLEIIEGFRRPSSGMVRVFESDPLYFDANQVGRMGIILQSWRDHPLWLVKDFLDLIQYAHSQLGRGSAGLTRKLIETLGLEKVMGKRLIKLSGGERRRVDICISLMGEPELLVLDEPTTAFDPGIRRNFYDLILRLCENTTLLWATHDLSEVEKNCDRVLLLNTGRIIRDASPDDLRSEIDNVTIKWRDTQGEIHSERTSSSDKKLAELIAGGAQNIRILETSFEDVYLDLLESHEEGEGVQHGLEI